jgi:hypothetical protein
MSETRREEVIARQTRVLQIIVVALVAGCLIFIGIAVVLNLAAEPEGEPAEAASAPFITYIMLGFSGAAILARLTVVPLIVSSARKRIASGTWQPPTSQGVRPNPQIQHFIEQHGDTARLFGLYMTKTIIGAAFLEGASFMCGMAFLLEGHPLALAGEVVGAIGVALHFPTASGVITWIDAHERRIAEEKELRGVSER